MSKCLRHIWEAFTCIVRELGFDLFTSHKKWLKIGEVMEYAKLTRVAIVNKLDLLTNRWMRLVKRKIMGGGTEKPRNMDFMGTSFESHKIAKPR